MATLDEVRAVKDKALKFFKSLLGETPAVGIKSDGEGYMLVIRVQNKPNSKIVIPTNIDGIPLDFMIVGKIKAREK